MVGRSGRYNESGIADGRGIGLWIVGVRGSNLLLDDLYSQ